MDLTQAVKQMIYKDPFYGHIAIGLKRNFSSKIDTACAQLEGINISLYFNEKFWNSLSDNHQIGLLQHELGHVLFFHLCHIHEYEDHDIHNIAADMVINQYIDPKYLPDKGILPSSFPELNLPAFQDTRFYYNELMKDLTQNHKSKSLAALNNHMKAGGKTVCSHPLWGKGSNGEPISDTIRELARAQIAHQIKEVYEEQLSKNPGCIPGHLRGLIDSLYMKSEPVLDWRIVLRQFKSYCDKQIISFTRNRPNKRYPDSDAITLRQRRKMLVGLDTSGSISQNVLTEFFTQAGHMAKHGVEIDICEWDYGIQRIYEFNPRNPWKSGEVKGGGGTNPEEVVAYLNKSRNHNAMIMMTDGYIGGSWDKVTKPILWLVTKGGSLDFSFPGKKIKVDID